MNIIITVKGDKNQINQEIKLLADADDLKITIADDSEIITSKLNNYAIVIDDEVPVLVAVIKYLNKNKYIDDVICFDNRESYYQYSKNLKSSPLIISMDFKILSQPIDIFDDTSKLYLKFKEQFPDCQVLGYTNFEDSGNPDTNVDTKKLIELLNKNGDSVFDKINIKTAEAYNNIVRDKIRVSIIQMELNKVKIENDVIKQKSKSIDKIELEEYINNPTEPALFNVINETKYPLIGGSFKMKEIRYYITKASKFSNPIFITGESGTGKENVARAIHRFQNKTQDSFQAVNCGAIPAELFESEMFGTEEGAYTGAKSGIKKGKIELANNGTLFLDEIGEISVQHQIKLLRVIEEMELTRVGGTKSIKINFRIITATNKSISLLLEQGSLREDFAERLEMIDAYVPKLPSLSERSNDIPLLIKHFISNKNTKFSDDSIDYLKNLRWERNVRQLRNAISRIESYSKDNYSFTSEDIKSILKINEITPNADVNSNLKSEAILDQMLEIVNKHLLIGNPKFTQDFICDHFIGIDGKKLVLDYWKQEYWGKNREEIINLIKQNVNKYKILLEKCQFIHSAYTKGI
jgi:transcriptional regulator with PAS, ATPase and Fis domain